jgi:hypothetical protein
VKSPLSSEHEHYKSSEREKYKSSKRGNYKSSEVIIFKQINKKEHGKVNITQVDK